MAENEGSRSKAKKFTWSWLVIAIIMVIVGFGSYTYGQRQLEKNNPLSAKNEASIANDRAIHDVVAKVGKLMELPKDEQPAMITIIDKSKLANELFFADALDGDQVLVYGLARKVIIYRPSTDKIIEATTFILPKTK